MKVENSSHAANSGDLSTKAASASRPAERFGSLFSPEPEDFAVLSAGEGPYLLVIIDTEEEFDWRSFSSVATSVKSMRFQERAQRIFERFNVRPTYVVDYPIVDQEEGYRPLQDFLSDGRCQIGTQLHPWVSPPIIEAVGVENSYPGNLPRELEYEKLRLLTAKIEHVFGLRPTIYRAGRYGAGPNTAETLHSLGYQIDCSVLPRTDMSRWHGPNYLAISARPYWFGPRCELLEIPVTAALLGSLRHRGQQLFPIISSPIAQACRVPGVFARLGLLERAKLTPEGTRLSEAKRLTRRLLRDYQHRVFVLSYHSPSLDPGHTPYVRTQRDLQAFVAWIEGYLDFFLNELGGYATTPDVIRTRMLLHKAQVTAPPMPQ